MPLPPFPVPPGVFRAGLGFRRRLLDLADLLLPAEGALWDFAAGAQRTRLAGALVTTGLADALGAQARDPVAVAHELRLDPDVAVRVLEAAAASRLINRDREGQVKLSRLGAPLRRDHPHSISSWVAYVAAPTTARAYDELEEQLRQGAQPSGHRRAFGDSIWEYFGGHPDEGARFGEAMRQLTVIDAAALARAYRWPRRGVICDVAGGVGTLPAEILRRRPRARGILIDAPEVLDSARAFLASRGLEQRVQRQTGDLRPDAGSRAGAGGGPVFGPAHAGRGARDGGIYAVARPNGPRAIARLRQRSCVGPNTFRAGGRRGSIARAVTPSARNWRSSHLLQGIPRRSRSEAGRSPTPPR